MKHTLLITITILFSLSIFAQTPPAAVPEASQYHNSSKKYIEYIPGNLPIVISAPHGGKIVASDLVTRSGCGTNEEDNNTDILIREIQKQCYAQTGGYPHIIINNLSRSKLDPNRIESVATCNNSGTVQYFTAYHNFIDIATAQVTMDYGKGLYIDLHGQSHNPERIDVGYNIQYTVLGSSVSNTINYSTIQNLKNNNLQNLSLEQLLRGDHSLGQLFQTTGGAYYNSTRTPCSSDNTRTIGYRATPSSYNTGCDDRFPGTEYFEGDYYSNVRHGSGDPSISTNLVGGGSLNGGGGTIDGIMTEVNRRVRDLGTVYSGTSSYNRTDSQLPRLYYFAQDYATVITEYIAAHYDDFTGFNYDNSVYDITTDTNPTPTLTTGVTGGIYTSTPSGLSINQNTGEIDLASSTIGDYVVTYSVGPTSLTNAPTRFYNSTQNIEITTSTLGLETFDSLTFKIFPNPTKNIVNIKSNTVISNIKLYNLLGQEMLAQDINNRQSSVDLSNLSSGSYLMSIYVEGKKVSTKYVIKD